MRKYIAIIIASLALFTGQAHAQRCLPKMQGIEVRANMCQTIVQCSIVHFETRFLKLFQQR